MATYFEYKCKSCGYTKEASPKGHDMIMFGEIYHYLCEECKEIVDVSFPYGEKPEKIVCPECGSEHIKKWNPKTGKCPKCGGKMGKTDLVIMVD
jgi:predicted nucleic acid-binding Zn ribbon protein